MSKKLSNLSRNQLEDKLADLERRYEGDTAYLRRANHDLELVSLLLKQDIIDLDHAHILRDDITKAGRKAHTEIRQRRAEEDYEQRIEEAIPGSRVAVIVIAIILFLMLHQCAS